ncbi:MAG: BRO family protein [Eubacteriales bacterium]|nr:BRO family protein [Eubacteriales bacterium]
MSSEENLQLFENQPIRTAWDAEAEEWFFSIVDVVGVLTDQPDARHAAKYWSVLKVRLKNEGSQLTTNCSQLKLKSADGKRYSTDVANTEQLLRIIQSIPSKKAEPFKLWLAQVGRERIGETLDPELIAERLVSTYERKGYTREWINQRLQAISARKELTDEWKDRGVQQGKEYAILTDELTRAWSGMTTRQYKDLKGLKKQSLRDNMSTTELTLNQLAEVATRELSQQKQPVGFEESRRIALVGGSIAGNARKDLEQQLGRPIITSQNAAQLSHVVTQMIEASAAAADDQLETNSSEE